MRSLSSRLVAVGFAALCAATWAVGQAPSASPAPLGELQLVFEKCRGAVVKVTGSDDHGELSGSGFFVDPTGLLYTAYSVGGETTNITVQHGDFKYPARRLLGDSRSGIALLKVETDHTPFLTVNPASKPALAEMVVAIGYPMDLPVTPSAGVVAGFDLAYLGRFFSTTHIRANVPVQRGLGGAPLLNLRGEVVGILISSVDGGSACFALPMAAAERVRSDFVRFGEVRYGWLGVSQLEESPQEQGGSRARIMAVGEDTPARQAGLQPGDILLRVGTASVSRPQDVLDVSFFLTAGDRVPVTVQRGGRELTLEAQIGQHPARRELHASREDAVGLPLQPVRAAETP